MNVISINYPAANGKNPLNTIPFGFEKKDLEPSSTVDMTIEVASLKSTSTKHHIVTKNSNPKSHYPSVSYPLKNGKSGEHEPTTPLAKNSHIPGDCLSSTRPCPRLLAKDTPKDIPLTLNANVGGQPVVLLLQDP